MNTNRFHRGKPMLFVGWLLVIAVLDSYQICKAGLMYGVTDTAAQELITFDTADPMQLLSALVLQGLGPNEHVMSIDFAPDGKLYGLSSAGRVYQIRLADGALTQRGDLYPFQLDGTSFSLAINPARPDEFRIASNLGQNLRFDLASGQTARESDFALQPGFPYTNPGAAEMTALAYGPGPNPTLYGLYRDDILARIGGPGGSPSPDNGQVTALGFLNNAALGYSSALVILPDGEAFYEGQGNLYSISLSPPPVSYNPPFVGYIGDIHITTVPVLSLAALPEPCAAGLLACGLLLWRRRRYWAGTKGDANLYFESRRLRHPTGRPRGRRVWCRLSRSAVARTHGSAPSGRPRRMCSRTAASSCRVSGVFTSFSQRAGRGVGPSHSSGRRSWDGLRRTKQLPQRHCSADRDNFARTGFRAT